MTQNSYKPDITQPLWQNLGWSTFSASAKAGAAVTSSIKPYDNSSPQEFQADTWVHLLELKSTFSFDEALLLCQISDDEWVAWIPDHGEAVLHTHEFCALV